MTPNWESVTEFEKKIAEFFGAPYAVAVDSCTHGVELCLRLTEAKEISVPKHTYLSIPMLASKLGIGLKWHDLNWIDYYFLTDRVADAAVLWQRDSYEEGSFMNISFQYQKHLSLGRAGMILCDNKDEAKLLKKMSYDGRDPITPWRNQNVDTMGYHYYCQPELAQKGLDKLQQAIETPPRRWRIEDWPDLTQMDIFKTPVKENLRVPM